MNAYKHPLLREPAAGDAGHAGDVSASGAEDVDVSLETDSNTSCISGNSSAHPKQRALQGIGNMVPQSLNALLDCVQGENKRNHQTRLLAAKYVLDVVLDRMPAAESGTAEQEQAKRMTPEQAVDELRRRLTVAK